ncbi:terpene synthase family protein [Streptomyces sp. NBC_01214]|uniref:terpene synthase family protein n=1 Tax=Streptomyces sp. NBC_01214 TaxID=2903777 RepID=UPI00225BA2C0|nr:terpene synthase family protein [Streptomyces sp. NBC_01214]MCX4808820.1 terpene synthase family protein [Streptomyces sp. NBC_01214]
MSAQWARRFLVAAFEDAGGLDAYIRLQSGLWGCYVAPTVEVVTAELIVEWTCVLFLADDALATAGNAGAVAAAAVPGGRAGHPFPAGRGLEEPFADLWDRTRRALDPVLFDRLGQAVQLYFDNAECENVDRALHRVPPPAELLRRRMGTLAIEFYLVLIEAVLGLRLSAASLADAAPATQCALEHIALTNDLFSFRKEKYEHDDQNLVVAYRHHHGWSLQRTVDHLCTAIDDAEHRLLAACDSVSITGDRAAVGAYLDALRLLVGGNQHWNYIAARYHGEHHRWNGVRAGTVTLYPDRTVFDATVPLPAPTTKVTL